MQAKIPTPVVIAVSVLVLALAVFFGMKTMQATDAGVPVELAQMQAEAEAKRSPGYGKTENPGGVPAAAPGAQPDAITTPGFSPGRRPEGQ